MSATLLQRIEAHLEATGESETAFGRRVGDRSLLRDMRAGRQVGSHLAARVEQAISHGGGVPRQRLIEPESRGDDWQTGVRSGTRQLAAALVRAGIVHGPPPAPA